MGETIQGWLQAVGIRTRVRAMERGTFMTAWREKKLRGVVLTISGVSGNAATRLESFVTKNGAFAYGALPGGGRPLPPPGRASSTARSARRCCTRSSASCTSRSSRRRSITWAFPSASGPRVDDIMATAIPGFYMSPYEDLKLRAR